MRGHHWLGSDARVLMFIGSAFILGMLLQLAGSYLL